ncbi:hypothetical protein I302_103293 [Kwoniella bestiolae CBS 10118]|uniref:RRM domain-containing protein n=1 Tax=Kwoniella bestiolae CBS 10118 TaxID=1296100 RepID=A0A1B9G7Z7_9TREE|nr:hypothetical protein I302_01992 [Kwoniella bestiolae CBS 10118]OCF27157.1 hypothetical protein I302_01992 [Kwoniella bestiolae CBS 10118]
MMPTYSLALMKAQQHLPTTEDGLYAAALYLVATKTGDYSVLDHLPGRITPFPYGIVRSHPIFYNSYDINKVCGMAYSLSNGYLHPSPYGGFDPRPVPYSQMGNTGIFCGGINPSIDEGMLYRIFSVTAEISWVHKIDDGFAAMIKFRKFSDAERCMWSLQGLVVRGRQLRLNYGNTKDQLVLYNALQHDVIGNAAPAGHNALQVDSGDISDAADSEDDAHLIDWEYDVSTSESEADELATPGEMTENGSPYHYLADLEPYLDDIVEHRNLHRYCASGPIEPPKL